MAAPRPVPDPRFGPRMRELMAARGLTFRGLAARTFLGKSYLQELAAGKKSPVSETARRIDDALGAGGVLAATVQSAPSAGSDDELDALELGRRVARSDVGSETLRRLEAAVDDLASAYATTTPQALLPRVRRHLGYIGTLLDGRMTLVDHRRLLVTGGWLSLLAATVQIDLQRRAAADANLQTARQLADETGHAELRAWCLETRAWDVLTTGNYRRAVELSRGAQAAVPSGTSAHIQATAQEGRALARMGATTETREALDRVERLVASLAMPDRPEHHYRYDPGKALAYTATTLAWAGDPAAEEFARAVTAQLEAAPDGAARPRRVASAKLDLGLALLAARKPDEAAAVAIDAVSSRRIVGSNWWRAAEVLAGVERAGIREAGDLRDALEAYRPQG